MRFLTVALIGLLGFLQAELWFGKGGMLRKFELERGLAAQRAENEARRSRNDKLLAEVRDLKDGLEMVEEKARYELGMVRPDEILVQISGRP
ncbi:MAG TPA: cell division protein FtsB [Burkholderiaceae bacterium]|nr:cell division protein FtsB [Burkholderiaceae bacterium]